MLVDHALVTHCMPYSFSNCKNHQTLTLIDYFGNSVTICFISSSSPHLLMQSYIIDISQTMSPLHVGPTPCTSLQTWHLTTWLPQHQKSSKLPGCFRCSLYGLVMLFISSRMEKRQRLYKDLEVAYSPRQDGGGLISQLAGYFSTQDCMQHHIYSET